MDVLIVYPENKEQLDALKAIMRAMKIAFKQESDVYPLQEVEGVTQSLNQANKGQLTPYTGIKDMLFFMK
ncbi:DUF3574 domain-containing protein [Desertivirga xinjiangensis]|uniref:DUF3574 domain-containing protein n=1 Tax=Desertivirga xinjiangensis TaxID=539206 RepID=UPI00210908C5|nr:DUF3574 domain-containing protein [Pedobacter xinjiangensis]